MGLNDSKVWNKSFQGLEFLGLRSGVASWFVVQSPLLNEENLMSDIPNCPKCDSEYAYEDGALLVCPDCSHEWNPSEAEAEAEETGVKDANGNLLQDGDTVTVIKGLKVKGSPTGIKAGTKVKNIRLVDGDHNIDCKVDGIGQMGLKSEFVKKG